MTSNKKINKRLIYIIAIIGSAWLTDNLYSSEQNEQKSSLNLQSYDQPKSFLTDRPSLLPQEDIKQEDYKSLLDHEPLKESTEDKAKEEDEAETVEENFKTIKKIVITGNSLIPATAMLVKIPYREGEKFNPALTGQLIKNLFSLNYFDTVEVKTEDINEYEINLHIIVKENKKSESIIYKGLKNLKQEEIEKKLKLSEKPTISKEEAELYAQQIAKLYAEKSYHTAKVFPELKVTDTGNIITTFNVDEGAKATIKRVIFRGNKCFSSKKLRSILVTQEDWLFGFMGKAGMYAPEAIEYDRYMIENLYQSHGYLMAKIVDTKIDIDPVSQCICVTFTIEEGELFTVRKVSAPGNKLVTEAQLLAGIPVRPGQLYSKDAIRQTLEILRQTWGQYGYIYADVDPSIVPNFDDRTVDIEFNSDLGNQIFLNRINILGNTKTRDYVIRRAITLNEGELLTTQQMDISKARVESLGFFDPQGGVDWRINKIDENVANLDLMLKEIKTGKIYGQIGYGGADPQSPASSFKIGAGVSDRNFLGSGIRYNLNLTYARGDSGILLNIFQPWIFNMPIGAGADFYHRKSTYEDFRNVQSVPVETITGGAASFTFFWQWAGDAAIFVNTGLERISYATPVRATAAGKTPQEFQLFQTLLDRQFQPGNLSWIASSIGQDLRNHPVYPSRGYNWNFNAKVGLPVHSNFGFFKAEFDGTWLTPLIGEYDLIFLFHAHAGYIKPFDNKTIPYRELYHVGGPGTVRGFTFGQIGPQVYFDSIGATKAFWVNAELIFSITKDQSIRGVLFYDGGAGWDIPNTRAFNGLPLINNRFNYRHAIGFGLRLTNPAPVRIDWGFKLDRNKKLGEKISEVHFTMAQDF